MAAFRGRVSVESACCWLVKEGSRGDVMETVTYTEGAFSLLFCLSLSVPFLPSILLLPSGVQYRDKLNEWLSQVQKGLLFIEKKVESH